MLSLSLASVGPLCGPECCSILLEQCWSNQNILLKAWYTLLHQTLLFAFLRILNTYRASLPPYMGYEILK